MSQAAEGWQHADERAAERWQSLAQVLAWDAEAHRTSKRPFVWQRAGAAEWGQRLAALAAMHRSQQVQLAAADALEVR